MLYLNCRLLAKHDVHKDNLTLTSVVFESIQSGLLNYCDCNLTLTSVVFEFI